MHNLSHLFRSSAALSLLLLSACTPTPRGGFPVVPQQLPSSVAQLDDAQVKERLAFLEQRLEERRDYAWYWNKGWTTFYGLGIIIQSARASVEEHNGRQADYVVSAVKALGGTINLYLRPIGAQEGADRVRELPSATLDDRRRQLAVAEEQLRLNAKESDARYDWVRHLLNFGVNAAGAVIVWQGWDDTTRAWRSFGVGSVVGEAMILSAPWEPADDWEEYQKRYDTGNDEPEVRWRILPTVGGAALHVEF